MKCETKCAQLLQGVSLNNTFMYCFDLLKKLLTNTVPKKSVRRPKQKDYSKEKNSRKCQNLTPCILLSTITTIDSRFACLLNQVSYIMNHTCLQTTEGEILENETHTDKTNYCSQGLQITIVGYNPKQPSKSKSPILIFYISYYYGHIQFCNIFLEKIMTKR